MLDVITVASLLAFVVTEPRAALAIAAAGAIGIAVGSFAGFPAGLAVFAGGLLVAVLAARRPKRT